MRYVATIGERRVTLEIGENGHLQRATVDDAALEVDWQPVGGASLRAGPTAEAGHYSLLIGSASYDLLVRPIETEAASGEQVFEVNIAGRPYLVRLEDERARTLAGLAQAGHEHGEAAIRAPMPGLVTNIMVAEGEAVERGQTAIVLEAMKMENDLMAPRSGVVKAMRVAKGQTVNQGDVLAVIGDPAGASAQSPADEGEGEGAGD